MPFDATPAEAPVTSEVQTVRQMQEHFARPGAWCQFDFKSGPARCMLGILNEIDHGDAYPLSFPTGLARRETQNVRAKLERLVGVINLFNDAPDTTIDDVRAALDLVLDSLTQE